MEMLQEDRFLKGYMEGYLDGIRDGAMGKTANMMKTDIRNLPVKAMGLSARACNCLSRAGCFYVSDVAELSEHKIRTMRNMGKVTASEVAFWLISHGILNSAWGKYL